MSFLKSILSLFIVGSTLVAMFTMFEIFGRSEKIYNIEKLKKIHQINGAVYFLLFIVIAYFCLTFVIGTKTELSPRSTSHGIFAIAEITLLGLKISFVRIYRQFYDKVQAIGLLIALITFGMFGMSGGYYLLVTKFGTDKTFDMADRYKEEIAAKSGLFTIKTDARSISKGKELYESKCYFCHDAYSNKTKVGPGLKNILKNPSLPVSRKPATPENVVNQIKNPYKDMPSFSYLPDEDVGNLIAFLNTL